LDHYHLGCLLVFELKLFSEGMAALRHAGQLSPAALAPLLALAMAWMVQDKPEKALPFLEEIEARVRDNERSHGKGSAEIWLHVARLYQSSLLPKQAYRAALQALACEPGGAEARVLLQKLEEEMYGPFRAKLNRVLRTLGKWWHRRRP
jgi:hypothetical protein